MRRKEKIPLAAKNNAQFHGNQKWGKEEKAVRKGKVLVKGEGGKKCFEIPGVNDGAESHFKRDHLAIERGVKTCNTSKKTAKKSRVCPRQDSTKGGKGGSLAKLNTIRTRKKWQGEPIPAKKEGGGGAGRNDLGGRGRGVSLFREKIKHTSKLSGALKRKKKNHNIKSFQRHGGVTRARSKERRPSRVPRVARKTDFFRKRKMYTKGEGGEPPSAGVLIISGKKRGSGTALGTL